MKKINNVQPSYGKPFVLFGSHKPKFQRKSQQYHTPYINTMPIVQL